MNNKVKFAFATGTFIILVVIGCFLMKKNGDEIQITREDENNSQEICVYITGEVHSPGVFNVEYGTRVYELIELADGVTSEADISRVNLAKILEDEEKVSIPKIIIMNEDSEESENGLVNINSASVEKLTGLKGIGKSTAEKIVKFREENGYFSSVEDIMNVTGIGQNKFDAIKDSIEI